MSPGHSNLRWKRHGRFSPAAPIIGAVVLLLAVAAIIAGLQWRRAETTSSLPAAAESANQAGVPVPPEGNTNPPLAVTELAPMAGPAKPAGPFGSSVPSAPADQRPAVQPGAGRTLPVEDSPPARPGHYLAEETPLEVVDVKTAGRPIVRPVRFGGRQFARGLWAQPAADQGSAQISYRLNGRFTQLLGVAGVADAAEGAASGKATAAAIFRVYGDGNLLWESRRLSGRGAIQAVEIAVARVDILALVCESESPAAISEFAWADLQLLEK